MILDLFSRINWVDLFVLTLLFRIGYIAKKTGTFIEIFKLLGIILATYFSLHYYVSFSDFLNKTGNLKSVPIEMIDFIALIILIGATYLMIWFCREGLQRFVKVEVINSVNKWVALSLGITRGILSASLLLFIFSLPLVSYFQRSVKDAYLGSQIVQVAPALYARIWGGVMSKFVPQEEFNYAAYEIAGMPVK